MYPKNNLKTGAYFSLAIFFLMLFGAVYYYSERMFFSDSSYIAFKAINEQKLQIQEFRFGAFITQIVPVLGAKLGLSIKSILIAYSASFNLFYLIVASILLFGFKEYRFVILFAFYWVLITTTTFFWPNNEVHQGIGYIFLLFPALIKAGEKKTNFVIPIILLLTLGTTAIFCHPLVLPVFIFLWVYLIAEKSDWHYNKRQTVILSIITLIIIAAKIVVSKTYASYDTEKLKGVSNMKVVDIFKAFTSNLSREIFHHTFSNYWLLPIISGVGIFMLVRQKKFFLSIWTIGCMVVYFVLLCLTFSQYQSFIMESELMAVIIIATFPFVFLTLPSMKKQYTMVILLFIFIVRLINFNGSNEYFSQREQKLADIVAKMKEKNLTKVALMKSERFSAENWELDWGLPAESMLLSASIWDNPMRCFAMVRPEDASWAVPTNNTDVMVCFEKWPIEKLKMNYFHFDTTRPYTSMTYEELMK
jgi:hypothetical protein